PPPEALRREQVWHDLGEDSRDDRAPEAVDPTDQRGREQRDRVLRREALRARLRELGGVEAAGDADHEGRERERPHLVERDVDTGRERGRLALADRLP